MQILTKGVRDELLSEILNPSDLVAFVEALQTAKSLMTQNLHQHISFDFFFPPCLYEKRTHTRVLYFRPGRLFVCWSEAILGFRPTSKLNECVNS